MITGSKSPSKMLEISTVSYGVKPKICGPQMHTHKVFVLEKKGHWVNTNDRFSHLEFACVRESVRTRNMG